MAGRENIFLGRNDLDSRVLLEERKRYKNLAYPEGNPRPIDLWYKNTNFGKINDEGDFIVLEEENLKSFETENGAILFAVDFVVDAFNDLLQYIDRAAAHQKIKTEGSPFFGIEPKRAWMSIDTLYHDYLTVIYESFVLLHLVAANRIDDVDGFDSFLKEFKRFISLNSGFISLTRTGFVSSVYCQNHVSGLMIEFDDMQSSSDFEKVIKYFNDDNFEFFRKAAHRFGFLIDKNVPWRLVANVRSKNMQKYFEEYGISRETGTSGDLHELYYKKTIEDDVEVMRNYFIQFYNSFILAHPDQKTTFIDGDDTKSKSKKRPHIPEDYKKDDFMWFEFYSFLRFKEVNKSISNREINKHIKVAKTLDKHLDNDAALCYINRKAK